MACAHCGAHVFASGGFLVAGQCENCGSYDLDEISPATADPSDEIDREQRRWAAGVLDRAVEPSASIDTSARSSASAMWATNEHGEIVHWNEAAERLYGYTAQQILGSPIGLVIPAERKREEREMLRRVMVGEPLGLAKTEGLRRDGTRVRISLGLSPLRDHAGAFTGAIGMVEDLDGLATTNRGARI